MFSCNINGKTDFLSKKRIEEIVFFTLAYLKKREIELSINFISKVQIKKLNKVFRDQNKSTDVLSFATDDSVDIGDIFLCQDIIEKNAKENMIDCKEELIRNIIHGILHLFGYDHMKKKEEKIMFGIQEKIVNKFI